MRMTALAKHGNLVFALAAVLGLTSPPAIAQSGLGVRGFDAERSDISPPRPAAPAPGALPSVGQPQPSVALPDIVVRDVAVIGDRLVDRAALAQAVAPFAGRRLDAELIRSLADALGAAHRASNIALFSVLIPQQDFSNGVVIARVIEGQIADVRIEGDTEGADLSLTRSYIEALRAERPLRQATLERYLLLLSDIPGRRLTSRLEPMETPGHLRLFLDVRRISVRLGLGLDNLGAATLSRVQGTVGVTVNALLREGDTTRLTYGAPLDLQRFSYVALRHQQPIGTNGLTVSANLAFLEQRRTADSSFSGRTTAVGFQAIYPLVRGVTRNVQIFGGLDIVDAETSVPLGRLANEATRVVRLGGVVALANREQTRGGSIAAVLSQGLDVAGARQRLFIYGDPAFTKATLQGTFQQSFFDQRFILRLRATAQFTDERLPSTELFTFGGVSFGRGFDAGALAGDRGYSGMAMLGLSLPRVLPLETTAAAAPAIVARMLRGSEAYVFSDAGRVENLLPGLPRRGDRAASAGFGLALPVADETLLNLEAAFPVVRPLSPQADRGARFVLVFRRNF